MVVNDMYLESNVKHPYFILVSEHEMGYNFPYLCFNQINQFKFFRGEMSVRKTSYFDNVILLA